MEINNDSELSNLSIDNLMNMIVGINLIIGGGE